MIGIYPREPWRGVAFGPVAPIIAVASLVATAVGTGVSVMGAMSSARAQSEAAQYQAQVARNNQTVADQNAQYEKAVGASQAAKAQLQESQQVGATRAAFAASNLDVNSGSPLDVQRSEQLLGDMNVATIRSNANWRAYGDQTQAASFGAQSGLETAQSGFDTTAGTINSVGSVLSGASSLGSQYANFSRIGMLPGAKSPVAAQ